MNPTCAIYARVSSAEQGEADKVSIPDQLRRCRERAKSDGFTEVMQYEDRLSGTLDEAGRPGFRQLMENARAGRFQRIYVLRPDRLAREQALFHTALKTLSRLGIEVVSLDGLVLDQPLMRAIAGGVAEHERELIKARTSGARKAARAAGKWNQGMPPYGLRLRSDARLEQDPHEAAVVRRIFGMIIAGHGRIVIAGTMNRDGIMPPLVELRIPGRDRMRRLRTNHPDIQSNWTKLDSYLRETSSTLWHNRRPTWNESSVWKIVTNSAAAGFTEYQVLDLVPAPIISRSEFEHANAAMSGRHRKGRAPRNLHLLTGLLECVCCGRGFTANRSGSSHKRYHYWICAGRRNGSGCNAPLVRTEIADAIVVERVTSFVTSKLNRKSFADVLREAGHVRLDDLLTQRRKAEEELAGLEQKRGTLAALLIDMRTAKVPEIALTDIVRELKGMSPGLDHLTKLIDQLLAEINRVRNQAAIDEAEINEAAFWAEHSLYLDTDRPSEHDRGLLPDPRDVLLMMVRRVLVYEDGTLRVDIDEDPDALAKLVRLLNTQALGMIRKLETLARSRPERSGGVANPELEHMVQQLFGNRSDTDKPLA